MTQAWLATGVSWLVVAGITVAPGDPAPPNAKSPALATPPAGVAVKLSTDGLVLDAHDQRELATRVAAAADELADAARKAERAGEARTALDRYLTAANWILAYQIEPMASRLLLDVPQPDDADTALAFVNRARAQLARAASIFKTIKDDPALVEPNERWTLSDRLEALQGFASAFQAVWRTDYAGDSQRDEALTQAAGRLSVAREDDREVVAAGAQLWQAYLYAARGRTERAIDLLPSVMTNPTGARRYGFYARVLRCRLLVAAHESYSASIALLARLEEQAMQWFIRHERGQQAQRVAALVRRQITAQWAEHLRQAGQPERAAWCDRAIGEIDVDYFDPSEPVSVLRLSTAAPAIVDLSAPAGKIDPSAAKGDKPDEDGDKPIENEGESEHGE